jgi:hypothetical protein
MKLIAKDLTSTGGEIYCHIFENSSVGVARDIFWSVAIDFAPICVDGRECFCALGCDWLRWPIRTWLELDGCRVEFRHGERDFESSFYLYAHHPADWTRITLTRKDANRFLALVEMELQIIQDVGFELERPFIIRTTATIPFTGLVIRPENLRLSSPSADELRHVASTFVDLTSFGPPVADGKYFRFLPLF